MCSHKTNKHIHLESFQVRRSSVNIKDRMEHNIFYKVFPVLFPQNSDKTDNALSGNEVFKQILLKQQNHPTCTNLKSAAKEIYKQSWTLISRLPLSGVSVVIITLQVLVMTCIATLLSRPINRWSGGNIRLTLPCTINDKMLKCWS